jgi:hypothetical protein
MSGPWLQTAVLCRQVAEDPQGRLVAFDILDGIEVEAGTAFSINLVIAVVRGTWAGTIKLRVAALDPAGEVLGEMEADGDPPDIPYAHSRIVVPLELVAGRPGIFWFDIQLGGTTVTRVPLRVDWRNSADYTART